MRFISIIAILALTSCGSNRGSVQPNIPPGGPGAALSGLGEWSIWVGGGSIALCALARVAMFFPFFSWLTPFSGILSLIASLGAALLVMGAGFSWLASNTWLLALSIVVGLGIFAIRHRKEIKGWLKL